MKTDIEIRKTVLDSIRWNSTTPADRISVTVNNGWVTLTGMVEWQYQKSKAKLLAQDCVGVAGVTDLIKVVSPAANSWILEAPLLPNRPAC